MKLILFLGLIFSSQLLLAQNFTEAPQTPSFNGIESGSIAFSDVNSDGYEDLLISGGGWSPNHPISTLFINDGDGNFSEMTDTPFEEVEFSAIAFSDINNDGHEDVLITGSDSLAVPTTKLYTNDGMGNFSEIMNTPFEDVVLSSVAFSDVNNDGFEDVLITGENNSFASVSKLYLNEGVLNSIDDLRLEPYLESKVYPNPLSTNTLNVSFDSSEGGVAIVGIYDIQGQLMFQQRKSVGKGGQTISIDLPALTPNNYFICLENGKRKGTTKLIVQ